MAVVAFANRIIRRDQWQARRPKPSSRGAVPYPQLRQCVTRGSTSCVAWP
ncbi:hypothetical protein RLV_6918 [Rhizobium leguminosarum bv. viciae]|nr:hypothetical protein RLV_6918 [Rhizobium leguminosarum bv. viciae]